MTVAEAFSIFKSELELPDSKQAQASKAQQDIRARTANHLYVSDSLLTGSYARHTKIYPLDDIDILLMRNVERVGLSSNGGGPSPNQALDDVAEAISKAYCNAPHFFSPSKVIFSRLNSGSRLVIARAHRVAA